MAGRSTIKWYGDDQLSRMDRAQRNAVNTVMGDSIRWAKRNHTALGWRNRSSDAEGSIQVVRTATRDGEGWAGVWGSMGVIYFRRLEFEHGGVLRNSAELNYPTLAAQVRYFYKRG